MLNNKFLRNFSLCFTCQLLKQLARPDLWVSLQWVPSHCGVTRSESMNSNSSDAATLEQDDVAVDVWMAHRNAARTARFSTAQAWPAEWHRSLLGPRVTLRAGASRGSVS